jgi:hypothetical protein
MLSGQLKAFASMAARMAHEKHRKLGVQWLALVISIHPEEVNFILSKTN